MQHFRSERRHSNSTSSPNAHSITRRGRRVVRSAIEPLEARLLFFVGVTYDTSTDLLNVPGPALTPINLTVSQPSSNAVKLVLGEGEFTAPTYPSGSPPAGSFTLSETTVPDDTLTILTDSAHAPVNTFDLSLGSFADTLNFSLPNDPSGVGNVDITAANATDVTTLGSVDISGTLSDTGGSISVPTESIITTGGDIDLTGTGNAPSSPAISIADGSILESAGGDIDLDGTPGVAYSTGAAGVVIADTRVETSGTGSITITGTGTGTTPLLGGSSSAEGVDIDSESSLTGSGAITISGSGGTGNANGAYGVEFDGQVRGQDLSIYGTGNSSGSAETGVRIGDGNDIDVKGAITISGSGSSTGSGDDDGVAVDGSATVTGSGIVSITGTGSGSGMGDFGVLLDESVSSTDGGVTIVGSGSGAGSGGDYGVVTAPDDLVSGSGAISITGTGAGTGAGNEGVDFTGGADGSDSTITITGVGSATGTSNNYGVNIAEQITGSGAVSITGTGGGSGSGNYGAQIFEAGPSSAHGAVTISGSGSSTGTGGGAYGVFLDDDQVRGSGPVTITGTGGGSGSGDDGVEFLDTGITGSGAVTITGVGSSGGAGMDYGFDDEGYNAITGSGAVSITGTGGGSGSDNSGVFINSSVTSTNDAVTITGSGSSIGSGGDFGVETVFASSITGSGPLSITGTGGGSGSGNFGVSLSNGVMSTNNSVTIIGSGSSTGSGGDYGVDIGEDCTVTGSGAVSITGTGGGSGSGNYGVSVGDNATSTNSSITITGSGSSTGSGGDYGVETGDHDGITASGLASITGTGSGSGTGNFGVDLAEVTSNSGAVTITGSGSAAGSGGDYGVQISGEESDVSGSGAVSITGTGAGSGSANEGVNLNGTTATSTGSTVTIIGSGSAAGLDEDDGFDDNLGTISGNSGVTITGTGGEGGGTSGGVGVGLSGSDGVLVISASGNVAINGTGGGTDVNAVGVILLASVTANSGTVTIVGSGSASGTGSSNSGVFVGDGQTITTNIPAASPVITGTGGGGGSHGVVISGTTAALDLTLGSAPSPASTLTLVHDVGGPISGTFSNIANGATITLDYNSSPYKFTANYSGGADGQDLVLVSASVGQFTGTPSANTSSSYNNLGNTYLNVFDGNTNTFFDSPSANGNYVQLDLGSAKTITQIAFAPRVGFESRMIGGAFEASNSSTFASGVVTLIPALTAAPADGLTTVAVSPGAQYEYIRYVAPAGSYGNIAELQVFGPGGATPPASTSTELTGTYSASTTDSYDHKTSDNFMAVFDNNTNTYWDSPNPSGNWVQIDLGASPSSLTQLDFAPRPGFESRMIGGVFEASNSSSFSTFTTLYTVSQTPQDGLTTVPISGTFEFIRYVAPDSSYGNIAEMELFGPGETTAPTPAPPPPATVVELSGTASGTAGSYDSKTSDNYTAAFDGSLSTFFDAPTAGTSANPNYVEFTLPEAESITQLKFAPRVGFEYRMMGGVFQVSTSSTFASGSTVTVDTLTQAPSDGLTTIPVSGSYQYIRYIAPANAYGNIAELQVYGIPGTAAPTSPPSTPTSSQLTNGNTYSGTAGSYQNNGDTFANAFDGSTSTFFDAPSAGTTNSPNYVQISLPSAKTITSLAFAPRAGYEYRMAGGYFEASNDANFGSNDTTTLYTISGTPSDGLTTITFPFPGSYQFVRYVAPAGSYGNIAEMQLYGY